MRKKEKVPTWNNRMDTLKSFKDKCFWYYRSTTRRDREFVPDRIIQHLTGDAWDIAHDMPPSQIRKLKGLK